MCCFCHDCLLVVAFVVVVFVMVVLSVIVVIFIIIINVIIIRLEVCSLYRSESKGWHTQSETARNQKKKNHEGTGLVRKKINLTDLHKDLRQSVMNTFFWQNTNTEYYSVFRNHRIPNIEYYSVLRKFEHRIPNTIWYQENPNTDYEKYYSVQLFDYWILNTE